MSDCERLFLIRQLRKLAKNLGYELSLKNAGEIANNIHDKFTIGDGIIKVNW